MKTPSRLASTLLVTSFLHVGCGGGDAGMSVRRLAGERPDIGEQAVARGRLSIPSDEAFNYTEVQGNQHGPAARGDAKPIGNNGAVCRAEVKGKGSATGQFLLGYCFDNATAKTLNAVVKLKLNISESTAFEATGGDSETSPTASRTLTFFVKDTNGFELKREDLVASNLGKGPRSSRSSPEIIFDLQVEPGRGYYLMLAGRANVKAEDAQSADATLTVTDVSLNINWREADSVARGGFEPTARSTAGRGSLFAVGATGSLLPVSARADKPPVAPRMKHYPAAAAAPHVDVPPPTPK